MIGSLTKDCVIGILGGGQLGRMLVIAASRLGYKCHVFDPNINSPASQVSTFSTQANYDDLEALASFAKLVDVVTYEFENIPTDALDVIENHVNIFPNKEKILFPIKVIIVSSSLPPSPSYLDANTKLDPESISFFILSKSVGSNEPSAAFL